MRRLVLFIPAIAVPTLMLFRTKSCMGLLLPSKQSRSFSSPKNNNNQKKSFRHGNIPKALIENDGDYTNQDGSSSSSSSITFPTKKTQKCSSGSTSPASLKNVRIVSTTLVDTSCSSSSLNMNKVMFSSHWEAEQNANEFQRRIEEMLSDSFFDWTNHHSNNIDTAKRRIHDTSSSDKKTSQQQQHHRQQQSLEVLHANILETGSDSIANCYIKNMPRRDLLPRTAEMALGRQIQTLTQWEEKRRLFKDEHHRDPSISEWANSVKTTVPDLLRQRRRSHRAKTALMEANLRLVVNAARRASKHSEGKRSISFRSACRDGIVGLARATEKFDPELGFRFSTYAIWWIHRSIHHQRSVDSEELVDSFFYDSLLKQDEQIHLVNGLDQLPADKNKINHNSNDDTEKGKSGGLDHFFGDEMPNSKSNKMKEEVRSLIKTLSPNEQAVVRLRYGLDGGRSYSLDEIGMTFSMEKERIRKIESRAMLKLRKPYKG